MKIVDDAAVAGQVPVRDIRVGECFLVSGGDPYLYVRITHKHPHVVVWPAEMEGEPLCGGELMVWAVELDNGLLLDPFDPGLQVIPVDTAVHILTREGVGGGKEGQP